MIARTAFLGLALAASGNDQNVRLNEPLAAPQEVKGFLGTPDGSRVLYTADQDTAGVFELYVVPADRSTPPEKLSGALVTGGDVGTALELTPDGSSVLFTADADTDETVELYSVLLDGSQAPTKLSGQTVPLGKVGRFEIDPGGSHVVFLADREVGGRVELYRAPIDGSEPPTKLNGSLVAGGSVAQFALAPDGTRAVYRADQDTLNMAELYSVRIDGSEVPVKLNAPFHADADTRQYFLISPDSSHVVYQADQETDTVFELYGVPIDACETAVKLNDFLVSGDVQTDVRIGAGGRVVYRASQDAVGVIELYSALIDGGDGSEAPVELNGPLAPGGDVFAFGVSPDGVRVVYQADQDTNNSWEYFSTSIEGGETPLKLNNLVINNTSVGHAFTQDSERVVFLLRDAVWAAPVDQAESAFKLSGPLPAGASVADFRISADDSRVVYRADQDTVGLNELYDALIEPGAAGREAIRVNGPFSSSMHGGIFDYEIPADGSRVLYILDQETFGVPELYASLLVPEVERLQPATGPFEGGNTITLRGSAFDACTTVTFGGEPAAVTFVSANELRVVVPPSPSAPPTTKGPGAGKLRRGRIEGVAVDVTVSNAGLETILSGAYTYYPVERRTR